MVAMACPTRIDLRTPRRTAWRVAVPPRRGEREAVPSALHDLLRDTRWLVATILGTLWPEHLSELTARTVDITDPQAHARELLASTKKINVPYFFTAEHLVIRTLAKLDPRLAKWSGRLVAALLRDWQVHQRSLSGT